ncbi:MAG TPA: class I SAM-dependent methyltransferase, partial [Roseiflexaceae bacterium]|nr:class I SAM-dependent methyltransferase [Roseiflexaceae bacterium]
LDRIGELLTTTRPADRLIRLQQAAQRIQARLEVVDDRLFQRLRGTIRTGSIRGAGFRKLLDTYTSMDLTGSRSHTAGYDALDQFVNRLLGITMLPVATLDLVPEMVAYQPMPARIILEMVELAQLSDSDVFYDLGSGLGRVPMLVHLLSGISAYGIEYEPAYCAYARQCAADLHLADVTFITSDARDVVYDAGTIFLLYTPCVGSMLDTVLHRLYQAARHSCIRIFSYGPCTPIVARQPWLECVAWPAKHHDMLALFRSF